MIVTCTDLPTGTRSGGLPTVFGDTVPPSPVTLMRTLRVGVGSRTGSSGRASRKIARTNVSSPTLRTANA